MFHRIRHATATQNLEKLSGEIEADETFVGGKLLHKRRTHYHAAITFSGT